MKFRRRNAPLVLLLVPIVSALSAAALDNKQSTLSTKPATSGDSAIGDPNNSPVADISKGKKDVGTQDAPVDGKDGKPHSGPFVGTEKETKPKSGSSELTLAVGKDDKKDVAAAGASQFPKVEDGVMNDPSRELPKQGTTGTEGGVSEKDKVRKAQEGQSGGKAEKVPDSPKEAPPLPMSEESKMKSEKSKTKQGDNEIADADSAGGLEACFIHSVFESN
jgi:hypothetical protein